MREIRFKAKRKDNNEWVEGMPLFQYGNCYIIDYEKNFVETIYKQDSVADFIVRTYKVIPETVCQYTGLEDKEIWENDILMLSDADKVFYGVVVFGEIPDPLINRSYLGFYVDWKEKKIKRIYRCDLLFWAKERNAKVIGNIFDNPELLEGSHDKNN